MFRRLLVACVLLMVSAAANADFLGVYAGVGYWRQSLSGDVISNVSIGELGATRSNGNYLYVAFEHPIPFIPNFKLARTSIDETGVGTLNTSFTYQGQTFTSGQAVGSRIDLTNTDLTAYYEIIDTGINLDLGLTGRFVNGEVAVDNASHKLKISLPMVYGHVRVPLPFTHTYADGNVNYASWSGNRVVDYAIAVGWQTRHFILPEFGVELGWRRFSIDVNENDADVKADAVIKGVFLNLTGHF